MISKQIPLGLVLVLIMAAVAVAMAVVYTFLPNGQFAQGSPAGATFSTGRIASIVMEPATTAGTSTSITNTDSSARWVIGGDVACNNIGTAGIPLTSTGWKVTVATSSNASANAVDTTAAMKVFLATSTSKLGIATTSTFGAASFLAYWGAGESMVFSFNASTSDAAASCVLSLIYRAS